MGTFRPTIFDVDKMSQSELDEIALEGGRVRELGGGFMTRGSLPEERHGYGFRWVNTRGTGNNGALVLIARSARAAEFLRTGRIESLMRNHKIDRVLATRIDHARRKVRFGMESEVIQCVLDHPHVDWTSFPGVGGGAVAWAHRWDIDAPLSMPRLAAAAEIASKL